MKFIIALTFFIITQIAHGAELKALVFNESIQPREARAEEYDKAAALLSSHSDVQFEITDPAVVRAGQIQLSGSLVNTSASYITVYLKGKNKTLLLVPQESAQVKIRTDLPPKPRDSEPLYVLNVPPKSRVKFTGAIDLEGLKYSGSPDLKMKWTFQYWTPPRPTGEITFKLPSLDEAKLPPLKMEIERFNSANTTGEGTIAKFIASLRNVSNELQIYCRGSHSSFEWELLTSTGGPIPNRTVTEVDHSPQPLTGSDCTTLSPGANIELESATLIASKSEYEFRTPGLRVTKLAKGPYEIRAAAVSGAGSANGADRSFIKSLQKTTQAQVSTEKVETTQPISIP